MQWTDRIRQVKIWLVVVAIIITAMSLYESHRLVSKLQAEEHTKMEIWAEAMRVFTEADEDTDLSLVSKVIEENSTIPVVVLS
ncbi:MAG: ATP-binding protein, partial [Prevotella sp.]|nr:ATP-binding protein [Prevotella sp.]